MDKLWFHAFWRLAKDAVHHHVILVLVTGAYKSFYFSFFLIFSLLKHFCFRGAEDQTDLLISARPTWPGRGALSWSHPQRCWPAPSSRLAPASLLPVLSGWSWAMLICLKQPVINTQETTRQKGDRTGAHWWDVWEYIIICHNKFHLSLGIYDSVFNMDSRKYLKKILAYCYSTTATWSLPWRHCIIMRSYSQTRKGSLVQPVKVDWSCCWYSYSQPSSLQTVLLLPSVSFFPKHTFSF